MIFMRDFDKTTFYALAFILRKTFLLNIGFVLFVILPLWD